MESKPMELPKEWVEKINADGIQYESATQHEGLGPAIYVDGAMAYAPWLYTCQMNYAALQAKCDKYEKERYETRLAMRMLLKVFKNIEKSPEQEKFYLQADYIFNKYHNVADVLRNEALSTWEDGKDDVLKQNIEAEITRRWNSIGYNPIGTRKRESYRAEVEKLFNQKEEQ